MKYEGKKTCAKITKSLAKGIKTKAGIACDIGISRSCFYVWLRDKKDVLDAYERGQAEKITEPLVDAAFRLATGYKAKDIVITGNFKVSKNPDGSYKYDPIEGSVVKQETREHFVQSPEMLKYLLGNFLSEEFVDTRKIENTGHMEIETISKRKKSTPKEFIKAALKIAEDYGLNSDDDKTGEGEEG